MKKIKIFLTRSLFTGAAFCYVLAVIFSPWHFATKSFILSGSFLILAFVIKGWKDWLSKWREAEDKSKLEEKFLGEGCYGKVTMDGIEYILTIPRHKIWIYRISKLWQWWLWKFGINWHDKYFDECNPDSSCCVGREL